MTTKPDPVVVLTDKDRVMINAVIDGHYEVHGSAVRGDLHGSLYAAGKMSCTEQAEKDKAMTGKPDLSVVEALERITVEASVLRVDPPMTEMEYEEKLQDISDLAEEALPLARSQAEKAALYDSTREALEWLLKNTIQQAPYGCLGRPNCPAIIKDMIEKGGKS